MQNMVQLIVHVHPDVSSKFVRNFWLESNFWQVLLTVQNCSVNVNILSIGTL